MAEFMERVYRLFWKRLRRDGTFSNEMRKQIMRQYNSAIIEAQEEVYKEVTESGPW